ncbi:hypothetical protein FAM09_27460 [Niastella caeni]|uniref:Uncharacterized protein n=1 Tax=Niastella caeni TaxID=2569763 RepID=A0A4S8HDV1_9BACT|nr:hypothetical protein [Niastella caeni]THU32531.1 hypothetical protein FAM09_27460 [Niastella caeni]
MNSERIKNRIGIAAYELGKSPVVHFADQLAMANELAEGVQSPNDFEILHHHLYNHSHPHMRRLGSLALLNLPYSLYQQAAKWAEKDLQDEFKWVQYDAVRFFYVNATLDEQIVQRIGEMQTQDSDLLKAIQQVQNASREIKNSYQATLTARSHFNLQFSIPENWVVKESNETTVVYSSPDFESLQLSKNKCLSTLKVQFIPGLTPEEIKEMIELNMELMEDTNEVLAGYETGKKDRRILFTRKPAANFPDFIIREFIDCGSALAVVSVLSPLAHIEFALSRNTSTLNSFTFCP